MPVRTPPSKSIVTFPARGTPPDEHGYPHYQAIGAANARFKKAYLSLLSARRRKRAALYAGANTPAVRAVWTRRLKELRSDFSRCLGLEVKAPKAAATALHFMRAYPLFSADPKPGTPAWVANLKAAWYSIPDAAWDGGSIELLVLRSPQIPGPYPGVLLIPNSGARLFGAQSPESAVGEWGCALAAAGFLVAIPKLPGLEAYSSTQNKRRILEGACALGEVAGEAARALDGLLALPGLAGKCAWVAGKGLGGLAALLLGALDSRVGGIIADAPLTIGSGADPDGLAVPRFNQVTDLNEICATLSPRPLAFVRPDSRNALQADVGALMRAAAPAFRRQKAARDLAAFRPDSLEKMISWMKDRSRATQAAPAGGIVIRGEKPRRRYAICDVPDLKTWTNWARRLRREYRVTAGMPATSKPLSIKVIGCAALADCTREEFHIQSGPHAWSNVAFLRPNGGGPRRRRVTILCLPGSGSDVAKVEREFAHEIIAEGWNACIIDARVALYPFHPDIPEGIAVINQSLHDLCCCLDWVCQRDDVDTARIGAMGVSQGGTHSWMLAAMDERIAAAAPVCGVCTYRSLWAEWRTEWYDGALLSFLDSHSMYYFTPGVLHLADQQDLCGLIAPRPFALIGANHDNCFPLSGLRECDRDLRRLYRMFGKEENYVFNEFEGPHSMPEHTRKTAYAFFRKHLKG